MMEDIEVKIVKLEPMHVAVSYGFGNEPEDIAWNKLRAWMEAEGIDSKKHRFFGFNNPNPTAGSPNYGYEQWITIESGTKLGEELKAKDFAGGLYAVTRCKLPDIGPTWKRLARWRENSRYTYGHHQWLEECVSDVYAAFEDLVMDIYLPIAE